MALRTTVEVEAGGAVVRQRADEADPGASARLQAKAARLQLARGPGVVAVVRSAPHELVTEHAGLPIDAARLGGAGARAQAIRQVAAALAALHDAGLAHGAVRPEHVLVGGGGTVRLCGLVAGADDAGVDLRQLGELIAGLVSEGDAGPLRSLADALRDAEASRRPSARRVAAALAPAPAPARRRSALLPRTRVAGVAASALLALVGLAAVAAQRSPGSPRPGARSAAPTSTTSSTSTTLPPAPCVASAGHPLEPGACGAAASVDGAVVTVDGRRAVVGRAGDEVLVADWGCDGELRPAVLRPATGEVLVLAPLGDAGGPAVVRAERVAGATGLRAGLDRSGCAALFAATDDGTIRLT